MRIIFMLFAAQLVTITKQGVKTNQTTDDIAGVNTSDVKYFPLDSRTKVKEKLIKPGEIHVFRKNITVEDGSADALFRINIYIRDLKDFSDAKDIIQVMASNGRDSVSMNLPEMDSKGSFIEEAVRILHPVTKDDIKHSPQALVITVHSSLDSEGVRQLERQRVSAFKPQAYHISCNDCTRLRIKINSNDSLCAVLLMYYGQNSLNDNQYTVDDQHRSSLVRRITFSNRVDVSLEKDQIHESLYMYVISYTDDALCLSGDAQTNRTPNKVKQYTVEWAAVDDVGYTFPTAFCMGLSILPVFAILLSSIYSVRKQQVPGPLIDLDQVHAHLEDQAAHLEDQTAHLEAQTAHLEAQTATVVLISDSTAALNDDNGNLLIEGPSLNDDNGNLLIEGPSGSSDQFFPKENCQQDCNALSSDDKLNKDLVDWSVYVFMYLFLPLMASGFLRFMEISGTQSKDDQCYHNYACVRPALGIKAFNHIVSNIGFAIKGLIYLSFVWIRRRKFSTCSGIRGNVGLEICMALALVAQALGSSLYHLCPNSYSYQLDTPFIQVLCVLMGLKLYGQRRSEVTLNTALRAISLVLAANILSSKSVWLGLAAIPNTIGFTQCMFIFTDYCVAKAKDILLGTQPQNTLEDSSLWIGVMMMFAHWGFVAAVLLKLQVGHSHCETGLNLSDCLRKPGESWKYVQAGLLSPLSVVIMATNVLCSAGYMFNNHFFSLRNNEIVTFVCIANLVVFMAYYFVCKFKTTEPVCRSSQWFAAIAFVFWAAAIYFFTRRESDWRVTPAESRARNHDCVFLNFFDSHDIWHLLSAEAALFTLMAVSTVDDQIAHRRPADVKVF